MGSLPRSFSVLTRIDAVRGGKKKEKLQYMPRHLMIDVDLVTPANAKDFYFPASVY